MDSLEDLQRDLVRLESCRVTSYLKLYKTKCRILHLRWGNPGYMCSLGDERLESSPVERCGGLG